MIKCRVFSSSWERDNGETHWGPERAFNKFCEENEGIEILKIDTIVFGMDNNDKQFYVYYKIPDKTYEQGLGGFEECEVKNFKPGDKVEYRADCKIYDATVVRTGHLKCIIQVGQDLVETRYAYISKVGE